MNFGLIELDINNITNSSNLTKSFEFEIIIHSKDSDVEPMQIISYEVMSDYSNNISDYILLTCNLGMGTYIKKIYPFRDNLTCTVLKTFKNVNVNPKSFMYKLVIVNDQGDSEKFQNLKTMSESELNKSQIKKIEAQLLPIPLEAMRSSYIDGTFKTITVKDLIGYCYANVSSTIKVSGNPLELTIDIYEPDNDLEYNNLIVPTGVLIQDLPLYLQNGDYGVYNGGCGTYVCKYNDKDSVFIYPLYTKERFDKEDDLKLMIYKAPHARYDMIENTWYQDGKIIKMLASSQVQILDQGTTNIIDKGESLINSKPENVLNRGGMLDDETFMMDSAQSMSNSSVITREDGMSKTRYVNNESNMYKERSKVIKDTMSTYQLQWNFSYPEIIYPGMPVCYAFEDEKRGLVYLYGTVQLVLTRYDKAKDTQSSLLIISVGSDNNYNTYENQG